MSLKIIINILYCYQAVINAITYRNKIQVIKNKKNRKEVQNK